MSFRPAGALFVLVVGVLACAGGVRLDAQLQSGTIEGAVVGPDGGPADGATVRLLDALGTQIDAVQASGGRFVLRQVAPGTYTVAAELPPFRATVRQVAVTSAVPVRVTLRLAAAAAEGIVVRGAETPGATTSRLTVAGEGVRRAPARLRARGVQDAIATLAGWSTEDNGLLHVRGIDDGFLYVIDGVPVYERLDALFGMAPDPETIDSVNVLTGYIPPEFGWKAGGVIEIRSARRAAERPSGAADVAAGSDDLRSLSALGGGPVGGQGALTFGLAGQHSSRFLDPVHPDNLHNAGRAWSGSAHYGWSASAADLVTLAGGWTRSAFEVPHGEEQEEEGQDQRQRLGARSLTGTWQRTWTGATVSQLSAYHRRGTSVLAASEHDVPLYTDADRTLNRTGVLASVAHGRGRHLFKGGAEGTWLRVREAFTFGVTDPDEAEEAGLSEAALEYTRERPFTFNGSARPALFALYAQDSLRVSHALTVDVGVRLDWSRHLARAFGASPRLGAAYAVEATGTTLRGSAGRFLQPPQPENLLLSQSEGAWALSPFRQETGGGAELQPERQWMTELGVEQRLPGGLRTDIVAWRRWIRHVADPNVFFGTTILFPNSVAEGRAHGFDLRLELPRRGGLSAFATYRHARVVQFGPILGGLFLEDDVIDIGPGTAFTPDHDQRHVASFGTAYDGRRLWLSFTGRYESGTPLEVEEDEFAELRGRPGAELVDFERGRVKPRTVLDIAGAREVLRHGAVQLSLRVSVLNLTGRRWAYNFGNPFSGTHFGPGRTMTVSARVELR